jgi:hypothetical protein
VKDRVVVSEQDQRNLRLRADFAHHRENRRQRRARAQPARQSALVGRSVGHRIGKRHAQLDQVGAASLELEHQPPRRIHIWIACHDERN